MTARVRTILGVALFVPLAAVLLAMFACLPAPVGDPETSKVDPKLVGAWQQRDKGDKEAGDKDEHAIALLRPWDQRTYYLQFLMPDPKEKWTVIHLKAWLTKIGDATFITAEPLDTLEYAFGKEKDQKPVWIVGRVEVKDEKLTFRMVKQDSWIVKELDTREKLEAAIKAQVNNDELYGESMFFRKLGKEDAERVKERLKKMNRGD